MQPGANGARNFTQCDSLLIGDKCGAHTIPYITSKNPTANIEHEATTSRISEDQLFYCKSRGLTEEEAVSTIVNGFCREVMKELPMTLLLRPFNYETLSTYVYQFAKDELLEESALAALLIIIAGLGPVILINASQRDKT